MQNIPVFMAEGGTASLILREIPHRSVAYIRLLTIRDLASLSAECVSFCRDCGAETVLITRGPEPLEEFSHAFDTLRLHVNKEVLPMPASPFRLEPMTTDNDAIYQRIYNLCFCDVPGAATYDRAEIRRIYNQNQQAYLALDPSGVPCGIGELHGNELAAIGLLQEYRGQGLGRDLTLTLLSLCPGPEIMLIAASNNHSALSLYDSLGFTVCGKLSMWYYA